MRWLGHICRMDVSRQPKKLLFGEPMKSRPFHGTKQRWRDVVNNDLKTLNVPPKDWYALTMNRKDWYELYTGRCSGVMDIQHLSVQCTTGDLNCGYGHSFCHQGDLTRHLN